MDTNTAIFAFSIALLFFARLPLAVYFFNREDGTNKGWFDFSKAEQAIMFFYWYTATKRENKFIAYILNGILIVVGAVFLGTIVYSEIQKYN
jgi:hypothetical protein